jgi:5-formyltetrahydrofolate cyclo-ligase
MRKEMKLILANLDRRWEAVAHAEVCHHLESLISRCAPQEVEEVLAWTPAFPGEVDLTAFIAAMLKKRRVYLPRVESAGRMVFVRIREDWASQLERGPQGILQPSAGNTELFEPEMEAQIAVVCPGLAFDRSGRRLGRGGGYYDRVLEDSTLSGAVRIGVCYSVQIVPDIPADAHDIPMDYVCHERGVIGLDGSMQAK